MGDMLATGAAWLAGQLKASAARDVTYLRGTQRLPLSATIGSTEFQIEELGGVRVEYSDRDFIVPADDLIFDGKVTTPERGDTIEDRVAATGETETFEVMAPGTEQPFRYDPTRAMLRIHTKRIKVQ